MEVLQASPYMAQLYNNQKYMKKFFSLMNISSLLLLCFIVCNNPAMNVTENTIIHPDDKKYETYILGEEMKNVLFLLFILYFYIVYFYIRDYIECFILLVNLYCH